MAYKIVSKLDMKNQPFLEKCSEKIISTINGICAEKILYILVFNTIIKNISRENL